MPKNQTQTIPPFNPSKLYTNTTPLEDNDRAGAQQEPNITLIELNGILPNEDGQEIDAQEIATLVAQTTEKEATDAAGGEILAERAQRTSDAPAPQTTALAKTTFEQEDADDFPGRAVPPIKKSNAETPWQGCSPGWGRRPGRRGR